MALWLTKIIKHHQQGRVAPALNTKHMAFDSLFDFNTHLQADSLFQVKTYMEAKGWSEAISGSQSIKVFRKDNHEVSFFYQHVSTRLIYRKVGYVMLNGQYLRFPNDVDKTQYIEAI